MTAVRPSRVSSPPRFAGADGDLDAHLHVSPLAGKAPLPGDVDGRLVDRCAGAVEVLHERDDPTLVAEVVALSAALVVDLDAQPRVQEGKLPQPL
jgi:hypothetical protein